MAVTLDIRILILPCEVIYWNGLKEMLTSPVCKTEKGSGINKVSHPDKLNLKC